MSGPRPTRCRLGSAVPLSGRGNRTRALWLLLWLALILLPGVFRDHLRAVVWVSFVSLLYFLLAVQRLFAEPASLRALLELVAVVTLFFSTMFYVRWRARELRARDVEESP